MSGLWKGLKGVVSREPSPAVSHQSQQSEQYESFRGSETQYNVERGRPTYLTAPADRSATTSQSPAGMEDNPFRNGHAIRRKPVGSRNASPAGYGERPQTAGSPSRSYGNHLDVGSQGNSHQRQTSGYSSRQASTHLAVNSQGFPERPSSGYSGYSPSRPQSNQLSVNSIHDRPMTAGAGSRPPSSFHAVNNQGFPERPGSGYAYPRPYANQAAASSQSGLVEPASVRPPSSRMYSNQYAAHSQSGLVERPASGRSTSKPYSHHLATDSQNSIHDRPGSGNSASRVYPNQLAANSQQSFHERQAAYNAIFRNSNQYAVHSQSASLVGSERDSSPPRPTSNQHAYGPTIRPVTANTSPRASRHNASNSQSSFRGRPVTSHSATSRTSNHLGVDAWSDALERPGSKQSTYYSPESPSVRPVFTGPSPRTSSLPQPSNHFHQEFQLPEIPNPSFRTSSLPGAVNPSNGYDERPATAGHSARNSSLPLTVDTSVGPAYQQPTTTATSSLREFSFDLDNSQRGPSSSVPSSSVPTTPRRSNDHSHRGPPVQIPPIPTKLPAEIDTMAQSPKQEPQTSKALKGLRTLGLRMPKGPQGPKGPPSPNSAQSPIIPKGPGPTPRDFALGAPVPQKPAEEAKGPEAKPAGPPSGPAGKKGPKAGGPPDNPAGPDGPPVPQGSGPKIFITICTHCEKGIGGAKEYYRCHLCHLSVCFPCYAQGKHTYHDAVKAMEVFHLMDHDAYTAERERACEKCQSSTAQGGLHKYAFLKCYHNNPKEKKPLIRHRIESSRNLGVTEMKLVGELVDKNGVKNGECCRSNTFGHCCSCCKPFYNPQTVRDEENLPEDYNPEWHWLNNHRQMICTDCKNHWISNPKGAGLEMMIFSKVTLRVLTTEDFKRVAPPAAVTDQHALQVDELFGLPGQPLADRVDMEFFVCNECHMQFSNTYPYFFEFTDHDHRDFTHYVNAPMVEEMSMDSWRYCPRKERRLSTMWTLKAPGGMNDHWHRLPCHLCKKSMTSRRNVCDTCLPLAFGIHVLCDECFVYGAMAHAIIGHSISQWWNEGDGRVKSVGLSKGWEARENRLGRIYYWNKKAEEGTFDRSDARNPATQEGRAWTKRRGTRANGVVWNAQGEPEATVGSRAPPVPGKLSKSSRYTHIYEMAKAEPTRGEK